MMNKYSLFYNYHGIGDVLIITINPFLDVTKAVKNKNIVAIYHEKEVIGYNIFNISSYIKIKSNGLIAYPFKTLIDIINSLLKNVGFIPLTFYSKSSFLIGEVISVAQNHCLVEIGGNQVCANFKINDFNIGDKVVVCEPNSYLFNGSLTSDKYEIMVENQLNISNYNKTVIFNSKDINVGDDYCEGEIYGTIGN